MAETTCSATAARPGMCVFPFQYERVWYTSCADLGDYGKHGWCSFDRHYAGNWGYCTGPVSGGHEVNGSYVECPAAPNQCDEAAFPDKDHGLVCGECKVLVTEFDTKYNSSCDDYCGSFGRVCTGAWEERGDTCEVKYAGPCASILRTSDAICECGDRMNGDASAEFLTSTVEPSTAELTTAEPTTAEPTTAVEPTEGFWFSEDPMLCLPVVCNGPSTDHRRVLVGGSECKDGVEGDACLMRCSEGYGIRRESSLTTNMVSSTAAPAHCATEGGICRCPVGGTVQYGAISKPGAHHVFVFTAREVSSDDDGQVECNNRVFGDPVPNVEKYCTCTLSDVAKPLYVTDAELVCAARNRLSASTCEWTSGDGNGRTEKKIGVAVSYDDCERMVQSSEPTATGATVEVGGVGWCYAEFESTGSVKSSRWESCVFGYFHTKGNDSQSIASIRDAAAAANFEYYADVPGATSDTAALCEPVVCSALTAAHGMYHGPGCDGTQYGGEWCAFDGCNEGFMPAQLTGRNLTCGIEGLFIDELGQVPTCVPISCGSLRVENARVGGQCGGRYGDVCDFKSCHPGYILESGGWDTATCGGDQLTGGAWIGSSDSVCVPDPNQVSGTCKSTGDPHFTSLDKKNFNFHGIGHFTMVRAPGLLIQSRHVAWNSRGTVAVNNATSISGTNAGSAVVEVVLGQFPSQPIRMFVDRSEIPLGMSGKAGSGNEVDYKLEGKQALVRLSDGTRVEVRGRVNRKGKGFLNIFITLPARYRNSTCGLCGDFDGVIDNDGPMAWAANPPACDLIVQPPDCLFHDGTCPGPATTAGPTVTSSSGTSPTFGTLPTTPGDPGGNSGTTTGVFRTLAPITTFADGAGGGGGWTDFTPTPDFDETTCDPMILRRAKEACASVQDADFINLCIEDICLTIGDDVTEPVNPEEEEALLSEVVEMSDPQGNDAAVDAAKAIDAVHCPVMEIADGLLSGDCGGKQYDVCEVIGCDTGFILSKTGDKKRRCGAVRNSGQSSFGGVYSGESKSCVKLPEVIPQSGSSHVAAHQVVAFSVRVFIPRSESDSINTVVQFSGVPDWLGSPVASLPEVGRFIALNKAPMTAQETGDGVQVGIHGLSNLGGRDPAVVPPPVGADDAVVIKLSFRVAGSAKPGDRASISTTKIKITQGENEVAKFTDIFGVSSSIVVDAPVVTAVGTASQDQFVDGFPAIMFDLVVTAGATVPAYDVDVRCTLSDALDRSAEGSTGAGISSSGGVVHFGRIMALRDQATFRWRTRIKKRAEAGSQVLAHCVVAFDSSAETDDPATSGVAGTPALATLVSAVPGVVVTASANTSALTSGVVAGDRMPVLVTVIVPGGVSATDLSITFDAGGTLSFLSDEVESRHRRVAVSDDAHKLTTTPVTTTAGAGVYEAISVELGTVACATLDACAVSFSIPVVVTSTGGLVNLTATVVNDDYRHKPIRLEMGLFVEAPPSDSTGEALSGSSVASIAIAAIVVVGFLLGIALTQKRREARNLKCDVGTDVEYGHQIETPPLTQPRTLSRSIDNARESTKIHKHDVAKQNYYNERTLQSHDYVEPVAVGLSYLFKPTGLGSGRKYGVCLPSDDVIYEPPMDGKLKAADSSSLTEQLAVHDETSKGLDAVTHRRAVATRDSIIDEDAAHSVTSSGNGACNEEE